MELEGRADARDAGPQGVLGQPRTLTCGSCQGNHHTNLCERKVASVRGEVEKCEAQLARRGRTCSQCGGHDHEEKHHQLAAQDAYVGSTVAPNAQQRHGEPGGKGQGYAFTGGKGEANAPRKSVP